MLLRQLKYYFNMIYIELGANQTSFCVKVCNVRKLGSNFQECWASNHTILLKSEDSVSPRQPTQSAKKYIVRLPQPQHCIELFHEDSDKRMKDIQPAQSALRFTRGSAGCEGQSVGGRHVFGCRSRPPPTIGPVGLQ